jgi:hypothetical protein
MVRTFKGVEEGDIDTIIFLKPNLVLPMGGMHYLTQSRIARQQ